MCRMVIKPSSSWMGHFDMSLTLRPLGIVQLTMEKTSDLVSDRFRIERWPLTFHSISLVGGGEPEILMS